MSSMSGNQQSDWQEWKHPHDACPHVYCVVGHGHSDRLSRDTVIWIHRNNRMLHQEFFFCTDRNRAKNPTLVTQAGIYVLIENRAML